jgi:hypothetical protein
MGEGTEYNIFTAAIDGSSIPQFDYGIIEDNWLNPHEFFEYHDQNGIGKYELRLADTNSGKVTEIWKGAFMGYKVYPGGKWMIISTFDNGLQLINLKTLKNFSAPDPLPDPPDTFLRLDNGEILPLDLQPFNIDKNISASPDKKYSIMAINQDIKLYSSNISLIKEISIPNQNEKLTDVQWNPNSISAFMIYGRSMYLMNIPNGDIHLVETNLYSEIKWINGQ